MRKEDWLFSGIASLILLGMIASNILLMTFFLSQKTLLIVLYILGIILILFWMTYYRARELKNLPVFETNWITNNLLFWVMTDFHTIIIISRYLFPNERQGGLLPELFFLIHLCFILVVLLSRKLNFRQKHQLEFNFLLHVIIYGLISYSFIQFVIQTMQ